MASQHTLVGVFFLFLQAVVVARNVLAKEHYAFFWACDLVPVLFAVGFFLKDEQMVKGLINVVFLTQLFFAAAFLVHLMFGWDIAGLTDLFQRSIPYVLVSALLHFFSANVALYFTFTTKPRATALYYTSLFLVGSYILTLAFTPGTANINYVHSASFIGVSVPFYTQMWPFVAFFLVCLPTQGLQQLFYRVYQRDRRTAGT